MLTANTQFWRKLPFVAKYAFFVLFFGLKICVCAIFYAFSISGGLHMAKRNNKNSKTFREKNWEGVCLGHFLENHPAASEIPAIF